MSPVSRGVACALAALCLLAACNNEKAPTVENRGTTATTGVVPGDTFEVTGTAEQAAASQALSEPLATPFTIEVPERGVGGAEIDGATQNGKAVQINWSTGRPLPVRGGPGLNLGAVTVRMNKEGMVWSLDGAARQFLPGDYTLGSSVAVGTSGIARAVDSATFTASENTRLSTHGNATVIQPPRVLRLEGRDSLLVLTGRLTLAGPDGERTVPRINFGPGTYEITLTPAPNGYTVTARLQGRVVA